MFELLQTSRLTLRKPKREDAQAIYSRYASDADVTRLVGWPTHKSIQATKSFLEFSDVEWAKWPVGPYLLESRLDGILLGSTGLGFESRDCAMTGYVLAKDAWGNGYATEALRAMVELAHKLAVRRLCALCHPENLPSCRVLEKCGFFSEGILPKHSVFPNLSQQTPSDILFYCCDARNLPG